MTNLISRSWNGTPIQRRTTDGYVNATAMCKANGKRWSDYRESDRCQRYLDALSELTEIPVVSLYQAIEGRNGGTFVHPQLAVDLARWISAPFAVWMDSWFLEELNGRVSQVREVQPQLPDVLTTVQRSLDLLERLGGVDDRAQLLLKDIVLNHAARTAGGDLLLPGTRMLALQEAFSEIGGATPQEASKLATKWGKDVKKLYKEENGRPPKTHKQLVNGRSCDVCDYEFDWISKLKNDLVGLVQQFRAELTR
jgi:hypothetical protein